MRLPSAEMRPAPSKARSSGVAGRGLGSAVKGVAGFCKGDRGAPSRAVFSSGVARSVTVSPKATPCCKAPLFFRLTGVVFSAGQLAIVAFIRVLMRPDFCLRP